MATALSAKALSNLVCESSVRSSESVLAQELERNFEDILFGILARNQNDDKSDVSAKKKSSKLGLFLKELGTFLDVSEGQARVILTSYLAGKQLTDVNISNFLGVYHI